MPLPSGSTRRGKMLSPIAAPRIDDAPSSQSTEQPVVFKLQLRPLEEAEIFKPSVQLVSREFATRYLESVGVRPSKATMDLVNRNVPLTEAHIKTTLRAKGHVEDEIHLSVPPVQHQYRAPVVINPAAVLQLGIGNSVLGAGAATEQQAERASTASSSRPDSRPGSRSGDAGTPGAANRAPGGTDFLDMAARYLHPFNLDLTLARQNLSALYSAARHKPNDDDRTADRHSTAGSGGGGCGAGGTSFGTSTSGRGAPAAAGDARVTVTTFGSFAASAGRRSGSWPRSGSGRLPGGAQPQLDGAAAAASYDATRLEILEELGQPLLVTPEVVLTLQAQLEAALADWYRHQAPEALKGRLTKEEFNRTQEELSSEGMVKLLITVINFLHEELIRGHPAYPPQSDARSYSRDDTRSTQGRGRESLLGERSSLPAGGSGDGASGGGTSGRRSYGGNGSHRAGVQLPSSISIQQMTNLQKYDLGYQAYVRQKLEQRQAGGAAGGSRQQNRTPEARDVRSPAANAAGARPPHQQSQQPQQQQQAGGAAPDTQRVSFAVAPYYSSLPGSPKAESRPESPTHRGTNSSLLGPLNLPGSRSRPTSSSQPNRNTSSVSSSSAEAALASSAIPGLPPRVGRALRHSPSFALASAANTARSIHASLDAEDMAALQRERLFALHVDFASRFKALRQTRSGMFFTLPILLLATRLCVHMLFSTLYPLWTRLPEGAEVLEQMDGALCALFDPHGYLERALSMLQSTPSAIEAVTRHPQRRGNERQHFSDTSPLMQATLQGAKSAGARKLMQSTANQPQGRSLMRTQLSTEQRAALFQLGLQWMQQSDPVLSQVGEPHTAGRL